MQAAASPSAEGAKSESADITRLTADYGFLPRDHAIVTNLNARLPRLFPDVPPNELPEVRVLASLGMSANAFCHEDGVLIVTPELLTLLRYEEELDAILKHEGIHYRDAHIAESRHLLENEKSVARYFGSKRHHEIETDAKSFIEMADVRSQTNSFGYLSMLETLLALPGGAQAWDPDHGRLTDRILNLRLLTSGYELSPETHPLDHLSERSLTPIAAALKESATAITARGGKIGELLKPVSADPRHWDNWVQSMQTKVEEATRNRNLPLLVAATNALVPRLVKLLQRVQQNDSHTLHSIRYQGTYDLLKKLLSAIEPTQGDSDPVHNALIAGLLISPTHCQALNRKHQGSGKPALQQASEFIKMANALTPEGLGEIPSTIQRILDSGVQIPAGSCSTLVHYLASHLLIANCAYDRPDEETGQAKPDLSKFWQDATPILLEAYQVEGRRQGWAPERLRREFSFGLSKLAATGLNFRQELESDEHGIPLGPEEESALRGLLLNADQSSGSRVSPREGEPVPALTHVAQEIVDLQARAETFRPDELDTLIFDSINLVRSLPAEFFAPLSSTTDDTRGGLPSFSTGSERALIYSHTIVHSIRERIIARLDLSDFEQVKKGFQLIRYLPRINSTNDAISELFTELFSGLPPEQLLTLPREIVRLQNDKNPNYPWNSFSPKDFERSLAIAAISSLQAKCLLGEDEPTKFFDKLQSVLKDISPDSMPAESRSNLFRHAVDMLMQAPEVERPYYGYLASSLILDYAVQRRIRGGFLDQLAQSKPIAEMIEITTSKVAKHGLSDFLQIVQALDRKATSPQEHKLIFDTLLNLTTTHRRESIKAASVVIGAELFAHLAKQNDRASMTGILLKTGQDDSPLRTQIARTWLSANEQLIGERLSEIAKERPRFDDLVDRLTKTDIITEQSELRRLKDRLLDDFDVQVSRLKMPTPEGLLRAMYTLSQQERIVLARELLLGESGLLKNAQGRSALHRMLMESSVEDEQGSHIVSDAARALLNTGDTVKLAEGLVPLVAERICRPPANDPGWRKESRRALRKNRLIETDIIANLRRAAKSDPSDQSHATIELDWIKEALCSDRISDKHRMSIFQKLVPAQYSDRHIQPSASGLTNGLTKEAVGAFLDSSEGEAWLKTLLQSSLVQDADIMRAYVMKKLLVPAVRKCLTRMMSRPYRREIDGLSDGGQGRLEKLEQLSKAPRPIVTDLKRNSIDFIVQFAPKMGTPTVRMAQIAAQLLPLSPADQQKLSSVFESTEPQLACSAWDTVSRAEPEIARQLTRFGPRIGGGSLNSVFYAEHPDFGPAVVKVLVPQAAHRAKSTLALTSKTQQEMESGDSKYQIGRQLVELADSWVTGELGDTAYDQDDTAFRTRVHGKMYAGLEIYVPKRLSTNTATVRVEEFVAGDNLTKLMGMSPDLAKRAVAAGFQCYIDQISGTFMDNLTAKPVLVLSDISPGNARVTEDGKKLAILDRAFYQHITFKDRLFLMSIVNATDAENLATTVANYLREEGKAPDDLGTATSRLTEILKTRLTNGPDESLISFITVDAYTAGLTFPLRLQLIARGVAAWRQMALQAGFSSLEEARSFQG